MEYPGTHITRPVRLTVLIFCFIAFFVTTPLIMLFAAGFRYDWQNGFWRETGGLSIDIEPAKAMVYLDNQLIEKSLPIRLQNITPRLYHLRLSAPGYYDWEKEISVGRQQTTYIKDITLLKKSIATTLDQGVIENLSLSRDGRYLLYSKAGTSTALYLYDQRADTGLRLITIDNNTPLEIQWNEKNDYFVVNQGGTLIVGNAAVPKTTRQLPRQTLGTVTKVLWSNTYDPTLYISTSSSIFSLAPLQNSKQTVAANTFIDWYIEQNTLWALQKNSSSLLVVKDALGFKQTFAIITATSTGQTLAFFNPKEWHLKTVHSGTVLLYNGQQNIILTDKKQFTVEANDLVISPYNDWWLLSSPSEVWTYTANTAPILLVRSGETIKKVLPLDQTNTLGLQLTHHVDALFTYEYVEQTILEEATKDVVADPARRILFYANEKGLYSLNY